MEFSSRQLRAFLLAAQYQSFTRAAEALFITPSGLSLLIRELENQTGFRLFDRTTRQVALTDYGRQLLPVARRNVEELDAAVSSIGRSAIKATQVLSLGAPPIFTANVLPQVIKEFRAYRPELRIQLFDENHATILEMIQAGELDIGLGNFVEPISGILRMALFRFSLMAMRANTDTGFHPASIRWSALKGKTLISSPPVTQLQQLINKHLARAGIIPSANIILKSLDTQIAMVEAGEGTAILPSYALPTCRNRRVVMSRLVNPAVTLDFYQIRNRGKKLPTAAEQFTTFLQSYLARWAGRAGVQ